VNGSTGRSGRGGRRRSTRESVPFPPVGGFSIRSLACRGPIFFCLGCGHEKNEVQGIGGTVARGIGTAPVRRPCPKDGLAVVETVWWELRGVLGESEMRLDPMPNAKTLWNPRTPWFDRAFSAIIRPALSRALPAMLDAFRNRNALLVGIAGPLLFCKNWIEHLADPQTIAPGRDLGGASRKQGMFFKSEMADFSPGGCNPLVPGSGCFRSWACVSPSPRNHSFSMFSNRCPNRRAIQKASESRQSRRWMNCWRLQRAKRITGGPLATL